MDAHKSAASHLGGKSQYLSCYGKCGSEENHTSRRRAQTCPHCRHVHWNSGSAAWDICPKCGKKIR